MQMATSYRSKHYLYDGAERERERRVDDDKKSMKWLNMRASERGHGVIHSRFNPHMSIYLLSIIYQ